MSRAADPRAKSAVAAIMRDINGRQGLGPYFRGISPAVRATIEDAWVAIIERETLL